jgi:hypothetical protein
MMTTSMNSGKGGEVCPVFNQPGGADTHTSRRCGLFLLAADSRSIIIVNVWNSKMGTFLIWIGRALLIMTDP